MKSIAFDDDFPVLGNLINLSVNTEDNGFEEVKNEAKEAAKAVCRDAMLLSWKNNATGEYHPKTECGAMKKPAWIVFAESRGADLSVHVNGGEYVFLFLKVEGLSNRPMR